MLTGTISNPDSLPEKDGRRAMPRFQGDNFKHNLALVEQLKTLAATEGCTPAQLAIAWLLARDPPLVVLAGSSRTKYLEENAAAANIRLKRATLDALERIFKPGITKGTRYGAAMMARVGV
jgi:aryl-alcohol dehydrogenase-like predicted oxidoreductase